MQPAIPNFGDRRVNLGAQAAAARERAAQAIASFQTIRQRMIQTLRQNAELRATCKELRLQCRQNAQRSLGLRRMTTPSNVESLRIAHMIADCLSELGFTAFVFEAPEDTALRS